MSAHGGPWYACCGLGVKYQRHLHKQDRAQSKTITQQDWADYRDEAFEYIDDTWLKETP